MIDDPAIGARAPLTQSPDGAGQDALRAQLQEAFADRYHIDALIGRGQCSTTFRAVRVDSGDRVALKLLHFDPVASPELARRLADAIRSSQELADDCLVEPAWLEQRASLAVIVMPYMPGGSVETLVRASALAPVNRVEEIVDGVAASLDCIHERGAAHLGLTPRNILLDARGRPHVSDVGVTDVMLAADGVHGTRSARARAYSAPEQRRKQNVNGRADQYALAVIAFELLSGHRRLDEGMIQGIQTLAPIEVLPDVPLRAELPLYVNAALRRALSADAANRFATTTQFADALAGRAPDPVPGLPTRHAVLRLRRRSRTARPFGVLMAILVVATIADPGLRTIARTAWRAVWEHFPGTQRRIEISVDPEYLSASASTPSAPLHGPPARANGASRVATEISPTRPGGSQSSPSGPAQTVTGSPSDRTGGSPLVVRLGSSSPRGTPIAKLPNATTTVSSGEVALGEAGSWLRRTFGGRSTRSTSSATGYIQVSVDRGTAIVFVDGIPRGSAPVTISVAPGHHTISLAGTLDYDGNPTGINASPGEKMAVPFHSISKP